MGRTKSATTRSATNRAPQWNFDPALVRVLTEEFGDEPLAIELFAKFLGRRGTDMELVRRLATVAVARDAQPSWQLRRAAVLMLEVMIVEIPEADVDVFEHAVRTVAITGQCGFTYPPGQEVLAEGYSSTDPGIFGTQLRRRIRRLARTHIGAHGGQTSPEALRDFLAMARQECRLTLARYLFHPREVAARVRELSRGSRGQAKPFGSKMMNEAAQRLVEEWPAYEREVLAELLDHGRIFWVGDATSSELNALVEYPIGTVALVVKPPASSLEIELKRAGRRGDRPLSIVFSRDGIPVPPSHRLDGGSLAGAAFAEAGAGALIGRLYRLVHGRRAPVSQTIALRSVQEVPCGSGPAHLLDYFTNESVFGQGFEAMRRNMEASVSAFHDEWGTRPLDVPGPLGQTVEFLSQAGVSQAVLGSTSSFRLELLARYLGDDGPDLYFRRGLGVEPSAFDGRRLAETLLYEALGEFDPVACDYRSHGQFVEAVLAQPTNRARADAVYLSLAREIGELWGTLVGLHGYTVGESFVGRNVAVRSVWEQGNWRVRFVTMDHDMMSIPRDRFAPAEIVRGSSRDAAYIHGAPGESRRCEFDWLKSIYRLDAPTMDWGRAVLMQSAADAARRTREAVAENARVRGEFQLHVLEDGADWDKALVAFLRARSTDAASAVVRAQGRDEETARHWTEVMRDHTLFLEQHACLFGVELSA